MSFLDLDSAKVTFSTLDLSANELRVVSSEGREKSSRPFAMSVELVSGLSDVDLDADEEVVLRCGQASLVLRHDGMIALRGARIVSHSTDTNRLRGRPVHLY